MSHTHHLALYTYGAFIGRSADPHNDGFHQRNDPVLACVDVAPGLIARSGYDSDPGPPCWGKQVYPRYWKDNGDGFSPSTLSLWCNMESAIAFAYYGLHADALKHGREWFQKPQWPPYVAWWIAAGNRPDWTEGVARIEHLQDNGPTPFAFSFTQAFDAEGEPVSVDHERVKLIVGRKREA